MEKYIEKTINLRDVIQIVMKHGWLVLTVFTVIFFSAIIYVFTATPIYEAVVRLVIEKENPNVVSIEDVLAVDASGLDYYQTQYKIITSRVLAREVIKRLELKQSQEFQEKSKQGVIVDLKNVFKNIVAMLKMPEAANQPDKTSEYARNYKLVSDFIDRITVKPIRTSRLVDIKFQAADPVLSAQTVNTLAQAYIDQGMETRLKAIQDAVEWLNKRIKEERAKVEEAEQTLLRYKQENDIITGFSSDAEKITAQKLAQLNTQVVEAQAQRVEAETRYKQAKTLKKSADMLDSIPEVLNNELIRQIKSMEVELSKRMSELSDKYGDKHPRMKAIRSEMQTLGKRKTQEINRVINSLKNEYEVARVRETTLKEQLAKQKKESLELNRKAISYGELQRKAESARQMYELLIKRFKEASLTEDMRTGNIRIIDKAEIPLKPVKPWRKLIVMLAFCMGWTAGIGLALLVENLDNTVKLPDDITNQLGIPFLGHVPAFVTKEKLKDQAHPQLVTLHEPKALASEAYRTIRTSVFFSAAETETTSILITSAGPKEGKTTTAANLAITMAQSGIKVVLLDCDLRRPSVDKIFDIDRTQGMTNILVGSETVKDVIRHTETENLDVIPCGPIPPNPSELLGSALMQKLLQILSKHYQRIIIDSPPITNITDAVVLAKYAGGVVLVIRAQDTAREVVRNSVNQLKTVNARLLGAVLNGIKIGKRGYYYQHYYYYAYGEEKKKKKKDDVITEA